MRKNNLLKTAAVALAALMLASCTPWEKAAQKNWVKEIGEVFPDDEFKYLGHPSSNITIKDYSRVLVSSELYETSNIIICEKNGKLYSNYLAFVHDDACRDEFDRIFSGSFPCSYFTVGGYTQRFDYDKNYPVRDISADKFIQKYMDYNCFLFLYYDDVSDIPSEEEMEECILDLVKSEPHAYNVSIFCADSRYSEDEAIKKCVVDYRLYMTEQDTIKSLYVDYKDSNDNDRYLIRDMNV